jgi:hypothetical protein
MTYIPIDPLTGFPKNQFETERVIPVTDSIVDSIIDRFIQRSVIGKAKYGTDMDRTDLSLKEWLQHSIEEKLDDILYMQRALKELERLENGK